MGIDFPHKLNILLVSAEHTSILFSRSADTYYLFWPFLEFTIFCVCCITRISIKLHATDYWISSNWTCATSLFYRKESKISKYKTTQYSSLFYHSFASRSMFFGGLSGLQSRDPYLGVEIKMINKNRNIVMNYNEKLMI